MYDVVVAPSAEEELAALRAYDRVAILEAIRDQLVHAPTTATHQRKLLVGVRPRFEAVPPIWQLRVGDHRVFYDVDEASRVVHVRAVRRKPPHKATEEIL